MLRIFLQDLSSYPSTDKREMTLALCMALVQLPQLPSTSSNRLNPPAPHLGLWCLMEWGLPEQNRALQNQCLSKHNPLPTWAAPRVTHTHPPGCRHLQRMIVSSCHSFTCWFSAWLTEERERTREEGMGHPCRTGRAGGRSRF